MSPLSHWLAGFFALLLPVMASGASHAPVRTASHRTLRTHASASQAGTSRVVKQRVVVVSRSTRKQDAGLGGARQKTRGRAAHPASHSAKELAGTGLPARPLTAKQRRAGSEQPGAAAGKQTEDRVHAWYREHGNAAATAHAQAQPDHEPDLSPVAHKATVQDFERAAAKQTEAARRLAERTDRLTTDGDDAGAAAATRSSQIPSTAPTERIPSPIAPGNAPAQGTPAQPDPSGTSGLGLPRQKVAPVHLNGASASSVPDPRGPFDPRARSAAPATPTPRLELPAPAAPVTRAAPAIAAVRAASHAPQLDPEVVDSMTSETLDGNRPADPRAVSHLASALASAQPANAPLSGRPVARMLGSDAGAGAAVPLVNVKMYEDGGRLLMVPPMRGSHEILVHQNQMALLDGLDRIDDDFELSQMRREKLLVALPDTSAIGPDGRLPLNRRYARPWTVRFLQELGRAHYARFNSPLIVTSAARTVQFQRHLVRVNGNAAPPTGQVASPHLYGQAVDLGKHGMSVPEIAWMRAYLTPVMAAGKIDVEEEFQQSCFHISVYRRYMGNGAPPIQPPEPPPLKPLLQVKAPTPAKHHRLPTALLATHLP